MPPALFNEGAGEERMAEVYIAAAPGEESQALGLSEALGLLGFSAASGTPGEGDIAKLAEESKAVIVLWSKAAASAPWLTALGVLAQERKKLINAEREAGAGHCRSNLSCSPKYNCFPPTARPYWTRLRRRS